MGRITALPLFAIAALFAAPAAAQNGTTDEFSPATNVAFNASLPGWSRQQDLLAQQGGLLEGMTFEVASGIGADTATIRVYRGWGPHVNPAAAEFEGQLTTAGTIQHARFVDMSAAGIILGAGEPYSVEFVADGTALTVWGNSASLFHTLHEFNGQSWASDTAHLGVTTWMLPPPPPGPTLSLNTLCGQTGDIAASNMTPNGLLLLAWSNQTAQVPMPGSRCPGLTVGLVQPRVLANGFADAQGRWTMPVQVPSAICGRVSLQLLDLTGCQVTNVVDVI